MFFIFHNWQVTPIELATVYATIAARGIFHKPYLITQIETKEGEILEKVSSHFCVEREPEFSIICSFLSLCYSMQHHVSGNDRVVSEHAIIELHKLLQVTLTYKGFNAISYFSQDPYSCGRRLSREMHRLECVLLGCQEPQVDIMMRGLQASPHILVVW